jgi:hypothetical protein
VYFYDAEKRGRGGDRTMQGEKTKEDKGGGKESESQEQNFQKLNWLNFGNISSPMAIGCEVQNYALLNSAFFFSLWYVK